MKKVFLSGITKRRAPHVLLTCVGANLVLDTNLGPQDEAEVPGSEIEIYA